MSKFIDKAIEELEVYEIVVGGPLYDQEGWLLGYEVVFKNKREAILLAAKQGHTVKDLGYVKSIDYLLCEIAKAKNKDLLLYLSEEATFYLLSPTIIFHYINKYRNYNLSYPISTLNGGTCPICGYALSLHGDRYKECAAQSNDAMFECFRHRLKFNKIPLNLCGAKNLNVTKTIVQSEGERWLDALFRSNDFGLIFSGDKQIPYIKEIYGFFPDWIHSSSKKAVEYDGSPRNDRNRKSVILKHAAELFCIEKNWRVYRDDAHERDRLVNDLSVWLNTKQKRLRF